MFTRRIFALAAVALTAFTIVGTTATSALAWRGPVPPRTVQIVAAAQTHISTPHMRIR